MRDIIRSRYALYFACNDTLGRVEFTEVVAKLERPKGCDKDNEEQIRSDRCRRGWKSNDRVIVRCVISLDISNRSIAAAGPRNTHSGQHN